MTYKPCPPYAHHKNGAAERIIGVITEKARAMMIDAQVPIEFWGEAVKPADYLPTNGLIKRDDAPVGKLASFRYLASLAAGLESAIDHIDAVTAFLNPEVDGPGLYMAIPERWDSGSGSGNNSVTSAGSVIRLRKGLARTDSSTTAMV